MEVYTSEGFITFPPHRTVEETLDTLLKCEQEKSRMDDQEKRINNCAFLLATLCRMRHDTAERVVRAAICVSNAGCTPEVVAMELLDRARSLPRRD
jgi:tellurite resistance protein